MQKKSLGKSMETLGLGIGALIKADEPAANGILEIDINLIEPNKRQPRKNFDPAALGELAESIKQFGIIQPIIVNNNDGFYSIIAGERRWRAARIAKLETVPCVVKDYSERETLEVALIENIQRRDLGPIEEAMCYRRLIDDFYFTQDDIAKKIGKSRNMVSYLLGLLSLDERVHELLDDASITPAHGRLLINLEHDDQYYWANRAIENGYSIRELEKQLTVFYRDKSEAKQPDKNKTAFRYLENGLQSALGTKVSIKGKEDKGKIEIEYYSKDDLDRLVLLLRNSDNNL